MDDHIDMEKLAREIYDIHSPDGSIIDITDTNTGKRLISLYRKNPDELLGFLYGRGIDCLTENRDTEYIEFGFAGNSVLKIRVT